jgi:hypothetical protein
MTRFSKSTEVQSFLFDKQKWSVTAAKKWLSEHNKKVPKVDTTSEYHRFRQAPPFQFQKGTFRTIPIGAKSKGIKAVIAVPRLRKNPESKKRNPPNKKSSRPWLPATLVDLADPISVDLEDGRQLKFPRSGKWALCSNRSGTEIWILSRQDSTRVKATDEQAENLFEKFTGFEHDQENNALMVQVAPKKMERISRAMNIVYRSDKFSRPGKTSDYIHPFKIYPVVSVDNETKPTIVALRGGQIKIKKEGVTG